MREAPAPLEPFGPLDRHRAQPEGAPCPPGAGPPPARSPGPARGTPPAARTRVAIVDDHELFAEALDVALTLDGYDVRRVPVGAQPASAAGVLDRVQRTRADVVILDLELGPAGDGNLLIEPLVARQVAVMVVSATADPGRLGESLLRGAHAAVPKSAPLETVLAQLREVAAGRPAMAPEHRRDLVGDAAVQRRWGGEARQRLESLSRREGEVLGELMSGRTVVEVARRCYVSEATVRTQVKSIRRKLGVRSQLAAVGVAERAGWRPPAPSAPH